MNEMSGSSGFPQAIRVDDTIYLGLATGEAADIESQTARSFERLVARIEAAGARIADLVNLRTYYVYAGAQGRDITDYWERMTAIRLRYIADPGPAATALRVLGVPDSRTLIGVDGVATLRTVRQRLMPAHSWNWSIPVPLSQGWRVDNSVYVGGQISADRQGRAIEVNNILAQARNALEYVRHVLREGGQAWSDVVSMRLCFKHDGDAVAAEQLLATIVGMIRTTVPEPRPALTTLGVNLLYEGLVLEIDAVARLEFKRGVPAKRRSGRVSFDGFPIACITGAELHIAGIVADPGAALTVQVEATLQRLTNIIEGCGFELSELVKLTVCYVPGGDATQTAAELSQILTLIEAGLPPPRPVLTLLSLPGLPFRGQRFQIDGLAVHTGDRHAFFMDNE